MSMEWHRRHYGVPVQRGQRVIFDGKPGVVVSAPDNYLRIRLDENPRRKISVHPKWRMTYLDDSGQPIGPALTSTEGAS